MHVHTRHSGMCTIPLARRVCRESYSEPAEVYDRLKHMGMHLVTITDHDSIDAVEVLRKHPDFFLSEEVTCRMPSGTELHVGVYDINDKQHAEIAERRNDLPRLVAYLQEQDLLFSANHVFSSLTGRRTFSDFEHFDALFPIIETLNGHMPPALNAHSASLARWLGKPGIGGSDAHVLRSAGLAYTEAPGARTKNEFLAAVRQGRCLVAGGAGGYFKLTRDVMLIVASMVREKPATLPLALAALAVPAVTLVNLVYERTFAHWWMRRLELARVVNAGTGTLGEASA